MPLDSYDDDDSECNSRMLGRLSNPPDYYIFHFILVHLFYGRAKSLRGKYYYLAC